MEAPDARRAFPCFDEPNMKAQFSIVLGRKKSMKTASNMNIISTVPMSAILILYSLFIYTLYILLIRSDGMPDYVWDYYQTTVKMSSYLVAFLVSEFEDVATTTTHRVPFRLWVKPESRHLAG